HPNPKPADIRWLQPTFRPVEIRTADGERIRGLWTPPQGGAGVVLYLHGNAGNLGDRRDRLKDVAATGAGVLAIDYRGYGGSTGQPSEQGLYADARAAWAWIAREAPRRPVVLWGESLGTAVAVRLATEVDETGVVLDSPLSSTAGLLRARAPWYPSELVRQRFDSARKVSAIGSPLIIAHCDTDHVVPFAEGRAVFEAAQEPKRFIAMHSCSHIEIWNDPAKAAILGFLAERIGARS
ncbi:MAG: alpha/beta hydrolase, partial [Phenylobacterium sp.]